MSPLRRRGLLAGVALALVAAATVGILVVAASDSDAAGGRPPRKAAGDPVVARPERHRGPQGQVGQFVVNCRYSHTAQNDPIVHFDMEGMSHSHDFYGAVSVDHTSLAEDLLDDGTTCAKKVDTASYWHPTVYLGDEAVEPLDLNAYYRAAPGVDPLDVETMPLGLALVAGDQFASEPQEGEATGWTCGTRTDVSDDPPECPQSAAAPGAHVPGLLGRRVPRCRGPGLARRLLGRRGLPGDPPGAHPAADHVGPLPDLRPGRRPAPGLGQCVLRPRRLPQRLGARRPPP